MRKLLLPFLAVFQILFSSGARILIVPVFMQSHTRDAETLANEIQRNGHEVTVVMTDINMDLPFVVSGAAYQRFFINHSAFSPDRVLKFFEGMAYNGGFDVKGLYDHAKHDRDMCEALLEDEKFLALARQSDLILGEFSGLCALVVGEVLGKPVVVYLSTLITWARRELGVPLPPSFVPALTSRFTDSMGFFHRVSNFIVVAVDYLAHEVISRWLFAHSLRKYNVSTPLTDILGKAELHLVFMDFVLEYPHPISPDIIFVGSMTTKPAETLPEDLEKFISLYKETGVVVVSFGSIVEEFRDGFLDNMAQAFTRLKHGVIWKVKGLPANFNVSSNVLVRTWIPQNDLLGHRHVKAFVNHAGTRSIMEAMYHGVPMLVAPLFGDQFDFAVRVVDRLKMGRQINIITAGVDDWEDAFTDVLNNPKYKDHALALSKIVRASRRDGLKTAMEWINYTIACGGRLPHLHLAGKNLPWYSYHSIDVMAFLFVLGVGLVAASIFCARHLSKCLVVTGKKMEDKKND